MGHHVNKWHVTAIMLVGRPKPATAKLVSFGPNGTLGGAAAWVDSSQVLSISHSCSEGRDHCISHPDQVAQERQAQSRVPVTLVGAL